MPKVNIKALEKRPEGRPTKYNPDVFVKIEKYLSQCGREQTELPTFEGLALYLDVNGDTLVEWSKKYPNFSAAIKKILMKQKQQLMNDGMYGGKEVNQAMAIFLLKVNHGMIEPPTSLTQINVDKSGEGLVIEIVEDTNYNDGEDKNSEHS